jgi:hypothetical protein
MARTVRLNPDPLFRDRWLDYFASERGIQLSAAERAELVAELDAMIRDMRAVRRVLTAPVRTCEVCGVRFVGRADARYHGDACRQRAHRARVTDSATH